MDSSASVLPRRRHPQCLLLGWRTPGDWYSFSWHPRFGKLEKLDTYTERGCKRQVGNSGNTSRLERHPNDGRIVERLKNYNGMHGFGHWMIGSTCKMLVSDMKGAGQRARCPAKTFTRRASVRSKANLAESSWAFSDGRPMCTTQSALGWRGLCASAKKTDGTTWICVHTLDRNSKPLHRNTKSFCNLLGFKPKRSPTLKHRKHRCEIMRWPTKVLHKIYEAAPETFKQIVRT